MRPSLAETDLFILRGAGPSEPGLSEFHSFFNRNQLSARISGLVGNESVLGNEAIASGVWNRISFSVGQFHYDTVGLRENNGHNRDIQNAFVQYQVSPSTMLQAEFRTNDTITGDLFLRFDPTNFSPLLEDESRSAVRRFGLRHRFSRHSQLIASLSHVSGDFEFSKLSLELDPRVPRPQSLPTLTVSLRRYATSSAAVGSASVPVRVTSAAPDKHKPRPNSAPRSIGPVLFARPTTRNRPISTPIRRLTGRPE